MRLGLRKAGIVRCAAAVVWLVVGLPVMGFADDTPAPAAGAEQAAPPTGDAPIQHLDINEFRVDGTHILPRLAVEEAVYPYLGPDRTLDDVEKARAALEKAYVALGYQTVAVEIPQQRVAGGVVVLKVTEGTVGRLRVHGARYFALDEIKEQAPSLAEGTVPDFNKIQKDIVALNQLPDRKVTPALRAGVTPGTVDVDLNVEDTLPLHGSLELNNRYSVNTTPLRLNASLRYDNLWQLGHSLSLSYQIAPENPQDAKVFSGSYLARLADVNWLSLLVYGLQSDSDVATLGSTDVAGRGQVIGSRAIITLPNEEGFFHSLSVGGDYKHFDENVSLGGSRNSTPITYYPLNATYSASWQGEESLTQLNAGVTLHTRGLGSSAAQFDAKRFNSGGDFIYFRGDIARTQELPEKLQLFGKVQFQTASQPLVNSEQLVGGGLDTVRGYTESEVLGDDGVLGSLELRTPLLSNWLGDIPQVNEWRFYLFNEGGSLSIQAPLAEQKSTFNLASVGIGSRIRLLNNLNGQIDLAVPLISQTTTQAYSPQVKFRLWGEF